MEYKTVKEFNFDEYIVKHSKFIGYAKPVKTKEEAENFIEEIKRKHWDASHNVYAYVLRNDNIKRYSDDGEPQGTAGVPVLDVIEKEKLYDVCVVVTRYFGGILLGGGGLVRAYSHSAKIAVEGAKIITVALCVDLCINCDYSSYGKIESFLRNENAQIIKSDFADDVRILCRIKKDNYETFEKALIDLTNGQIHSEIIEEKFTDF